MTDRPDRPSDEPSPEELERQLAAIKTGMGLAERYPGQRRMWLVVGAGVMVASVATNVSFVVDMPPAGYVLLWFGLAVVVLVAQWRLGAESQPDDGLPGPDWRAVGGAFVLGLVSLWIAIGNVIGESTAGAVRGAHYFSHLLVFVGVGLLVTGAILRAQRIRRRDRIPFYVGGLWTLALAAVVPHVTLLRYWGYAVFGVLFMVHAVGTYVLTDPH